MALIDIDDAAARGRLREIVTANKAALDARVRQAAELAEQARQDFEREEAELKAALQRKAEAEAARAAAPEQQETEDKPKPRPKPSTLSLGAEEFKLERQARQAAEQPQPAPEPVPAKPAPAEPEPPGESPSRRTLKLGARDDEDVPQQDRPARKRAPRAEVDDDMSGRTWLR